MKRLLAVLIALCLAGVALGAQSPTGNKLDTSHKGQSLGDGARGPRTGGDTIANATVITSWPFEDTGTTCSYNNDYDEVCPYSGSTSPDVVYSYTAHGNEVIGLELCSSLYDTKLYVYAGAVGNLVACNDDAGCGYSGYQSIIQNVSMTAGVTYYIVVDGYGGACGTYTLRNWYVPCQVDCPAGAMHESEPPCGNNYYDTYDGGCNGSGWLSIPAQDNGCADLCGKSGTYLYNGLSYRDTDWFDVIGDGGTMTYQARAEFPLEMIFIYGTDCNNLLYDLTTESICATGQLARTVADGAHVWLSIGPSAFTGVPCDGLSSDYVIHVCGIGSAPTPSRKASWGTIKNLYR
jgi:hypothetical protein